MGKKNHRYTLFFYHLPYMYRFLYCKTSVYVFDGGVMGTVDGGFLREEEE